MVFTRSACRPGAVRWIDLVFGDCIYSDSELGSFLVGLLGIGLWVIAQMPQVLENFRNQSAEGLSIWFLLQWLLGDSLNLLGCVVQGEQLLTTTLLAVYFVASDVVLLGQYWWYEVLLKCTCQGHHAPPPLPPELAVLAAPLPLSAATAPPPSCPAGAGQCVWVAEEGVTVHVHHAHEATGVETDHHGTGGCEHDTEREGCSGGGDSGGGDSGSAAGAGGRAAVLRAASGVVAAAGLSLVLLAAASSALPTSKANPSLGMRYSQLKQLGSKGGRTGQLSSWLPGCESGSAGTVPSLSASHLAQGAHSLYQPQPAWCGWQGLQRLLGTALGYAMVVVYLSSRLPQIHKNWVRKSAEGLSLSMFLLAGTANVCTSLSIVLRSESWQSFIVQLPWFLGSIGTVGLDAIIIYQACLYAQPAARQPAWMVGDVCPDRQDGEDEERGGQAGVGKGTEQGRARLSRDTGKLGTMSEPLLEATGGQAKV